MELTEEQKPLFEILNNFWNLLKPYVKDDEKQKTYKKIMSDIFKMIVKDRGKKYTDEWWESTKEVWDYPEKYKKTEYVDFAADLAVSLMDYWQYASKGKTSNYDFSTYISRAFISEWERLRT